MTRNSEIWGGLFWLSMGAYVIWAGRDMGEDERRRPTPDLLALRLVRLLRGAIAVNALGLRGC